MAKTKLTGEVLKFFQKIGARGGKARARKYNAKQRSAMARKGGRPSFDWSKRAVKTVEVKALLEHLDGISLPMLARKIGCSYAYLHNILCGGAKPNDMVYKFLKMKRPHDPASESKAKAKSR